MLLLLRTTAAFDYTPSLTFGNHLSPVPESLCLLFSFYESAGAIPQRELLAMEAIVGEMRIAMRSMDQALKVIEQVGWAKANEKCQEAWKNAHLTNLQTEHLSQRLASSVLDLETRLVASIYNLETQVLALRHENADLKTLLKRGLELEKNVKKREALTLARLAAERMLGRKKEEDEPWSAFFEGLSNSEWEKVGIMRKTVRILLANEADQFNRTTYNIPPQDVVGFIATMPPQEPSRTAWEDIFSLAFSMEISDEVFKSEVDLANLQEKILGR